MLSPFSVQQQLPQRCKTHTRQHSKEEVALPTHDANTHADICRPDHLPACPALQQRVSSPFIHLNKPAGVICLCVRHGIGRPLLCGVVDPVPTKQNPCSPNTLQASSNLQSGLHHLLCRAWKHTHTSPPRCAVCSNGRGSTQPLCVCCAPKPEVIGLFKTHVQASSSCACCTGSKGHCTVEFILFFQNPIFSKHPILSKQPN